MSKVNQNEIHKTVWYDIVVFSNMKRVRDESDIVSHSVYQSNRLKAEAIHIPKDVLCLIFRCLLPEEVHRSVRRTSKHFRDWVDARTTTVCLDINVPNHISHVTHTIWNGRLREKLVFRTGIKSANLFWSGEGGTTLTIGRETIDFRVGPWRRTFIELMNGGRLTMVDTLSCWSSCTGNIVDDELRCIVVLHYKE
jgi:hypothetical protein